MTNYFAVGGFISNSIVNCNRIIDRFPHRSLLLLMHGWHKIRNKCFDILSNNRLISVTCQLGFYNGVLYYDTCIGMMLYLMIIALASLKNHLTCNEMNLIKLERPRRSPIIPNEYL